MVVNSAQEKVLETSITTDPAPSNGDSIPPDQATVPITNQNPPNLPLPTQSTSPKTKRNRQDLPTFTASSSIPFGISNANTPINPIAQPAPALPHSAQLQPERPATARAESPNDTEATHGSLMGAAEGKEGGTVQEKGNPAVSVVDIWDVPETPVRHP